MKKIEATIQNHKFDAVKDVLVRLGVDGMTITEVHNVSDEKRTMIYRGATRQLDAIPKVQFRTVVSDQQVEPVVAAILEAARTGKEGDGSVVVSDVMSVTRIRTGETETSDEEFVRHEHEPQPVSVAQSRWNMPSYQPSW